LKSRDEQRGQHGGRFRARWMCAAKAPRCADHFNLSLHCYIRIRAW